jgi:competence protein ComEC
VPLSSLIVLGEILLCAIAFIPAVAGLVGKLLWGMIWLMNTYIEKIESIRFSLWDGLQISIPQAIFFTLFAVGVSYWLMEKSVKGLKWGLLSLLAFTALRSFSFIQSNRQQKIVVYNVPQKSAIDFIDSRNYQFVGDSDLLENDFARNFHLKPSRILFRIDDKEKTAGLTVSNNYINYHNKKILLASTAIRFETESTKPEIDLLVISKNPRLYIKELTKAIDIKQVVFDGSVPAWKTTYWKKDCDSLHIPWHDVSTEGAFVMKVD